MIDLQSPSGTPTGDAARFLKALRSALNIFSGIESNSSILRLTFDDGQVGGAHNLEDVPLGLYNCLTHYFEIPHTGWLHADAAVYASDLSFNLELAYEGLDGPLVVRFPDGSLLTSAIRPTPSTRPSQGWEESVRDGTAQRDIEAVVTRASLADLVGLLDGHDSALAEALLAMLSRLATNPDPPKGLVREAALWLARKVDLFIDEVVKTSGKIVTGALAGVAGYQISKHLPELAEQLERLLELAQD